MKQYLILAFITVCLAGCEKGEFNPENPKVSQFVYELKNGTYDEFVYNSFEEKLWTEMPDFNDKHVYDLLKHCKDTSLISPYNHFPINPISSVPPSREMNGKEGIMIAEYLLWCIEGIIQDRTYPSLTPLLYKSGNERLSAQEILLVTVRYKNWWYSYGFKDDVPHYPLTDSDYSWR